MNIKNNRVNWIAKVGMLSAVSAILMFLEIPVPLVPPFLKFDFSDLPALIAGFAFGPMAGVAVLLVKNIIHALASWSFLVGELANFLIGISFVLPAALVYKSGKTKSRAIIGMVTGGITMVVIAGLLNYFVLIPMYTRVLGYTMEDIVAWSSTANRHIVDLRSLVIIGITPFNVFKVLVNTFITALIYKKLSPFLHQGSNKQEKPDVPSL
ncbi:MAG TPA: ECF transporter S component [Clostridia bacterium]|nr:ECF transporter S component [Clostridia bacterium]